MAIIQCHFDYACSFWYHGLPQVWKNKLQTTQNKIIRFVLNLESRTHIDPVHFEYLGWLPVCKKVEYIILCHVFKIKNFLAPEYMVEHFTSQDSVHSHRTRFSDKGAFSVPKIKGFGLKSFSYNGWTFWNKLPSSITKLDNLKEFKVAIKSHVLNSLV